MKCGWVAATVLFFFFLVFCSGLYFYLDMKFVWAGHLLLLFFFDNHPFFLDFFFWSANSVMNFFFLHEYLPYVLAGNSVAYDECFFGDKPCFFKRNRQYGFFLKSKERYFYESCKASKRNAFFWD